MRIQHRWINRFGFERIHFVQLLFHTGMTAFRYIQLYRTRLELATRHLKPFRQAVCGCKYVVRNGYAYFMEAWYNCSHTVVKHFLA